MKKVKILSVVLCMLMLTSVLGACKSKDKEKEENDSLSTSGTPSDDNSMFDANGYLKDSLPDNVSYDGQDFRIYTWKEQETADWGTHEQSSNIIDQALYDREQKVKARFNVNLKFTVEAGGWDDRTKFIQGFENTVLGGGPDDAYHLVCQYTPCAGIAAQKGLYSDLNTVPNLDLEKPWWPKFLNESAAVGDKLYFASGDITINAIKNLHCMYVNLDLYDSMKIAETVEGRSIYEVVEDGDWTLATMKRMIANTTDTDAGEDTVYGMAYANQASTDAFFYSAGFTMVHNSMGSFKVHEDLQSNKMNDWFDDIQSLLCTNKSIIMNDTSFYAGKALFYNDGVSAVLGKMRDVEFQYSILPVFKYDSDQKEYYTTPNFWVSMFGVPISTPNAEMSGMIMEGLASESYRSVTDQVYYEAFQHRYLPDSTNGKMFDIITDNVVYDSARMFADWIGMYASFRTGVTDRSTSWTSIYRGGVTSWNTKIGELEEALK